MNISDAATDRLTLRREQPGEEAWLRQLFEAGRAEELDRAGWPPATRTLFLDFQFRAMRQSYAAQFPAADFSILLADQQPIGRLVVHRSAEEIHVVDIALLPAWQGRGHGTRVLRELMAEAAAAGLPLRLQVFQGARASGLYARLGFQKTGTTGAHERMEWRANAPTPST